ncbi:MAG: hypothetical protein LUD51_01925 [Clostridia bacterium]|nr:hypothetical protein [Clostridia bacterium]
MKKIFKIDYSGDTLLAAADSLFDEGRNTEALGILNKNAALNGNDEVSYFMYAEIYDELGLHDKAIQNLFKSLDYDSEDDPSECYKGLAVCYMNLADKRMCSYYLGLYMEAGGAFDETTEELQDFVANDPPKSPLKFVYPPEIADFTGEFDQGVVQAMNDQTKEAIKTFDRIPEGNSLYASARMNIATCQMLRGNYKAAEDECLRILQKEPDNTLALINMANVCIEKKDIAKAREIAKGFIGYETDSREEMYKIATIFCDSGMHREAYDCFTRMVYEQETYHLNVLYFRAVAAFNARMGQEALDAINLMLDVYPVSICALYTKSLIYQGMKSDEYFQMDYFFGLPDDVARDFTALLEAFTRLSKTRAREIYKETGILNVILWCFDGEFMEDRYDLQDKALNVAVKIGEYDIVRDYLLERRLDNRIKFHALIQLAERNTDESYGIVVSDIMFRVNYRKLKIGRRSHAPFLRAYGTIVARFSFIDERMGEIIAPFAERIYAKMDSMDLMELCDDADTLGMAMYEIAGQSFEKLPEETMAAILNTNVSRVKELIALLGVV